MSNGSTWRLKDVRHISFLKRNLVSMSQHRNSDYEMSFIEDLWKVTKGAIFITHGQPPYMMAIFDIVGLAILVRMVCIIFSLKKNFLI
ncbi:hypothetical protein MA16_Dca014800 [Dendrobium catenatum]|uniref:Uncharacterized protein n=1 Tax=Dendrobium catenatum TaxID=906689 RepID=A0A2I0W696_9ASPA|nr:hypothetical protein MA16_Dca014800 [Dendrobium catenatum]